MSESLSKLIHKRHDGDGWFVFDELPDRPGYYSKRFADHAALGLWGSTHHEFHLYETKISREDVKREMRDPTKVEGVGKYAHYWWLVVSDVKIIADVLIPDAWGILVPVKRGGSEFLKVHRKAPKRKPTPFSPMFCVSLLRCFGKSWVQPSKFRALEEEIYRLKHPSATDEDVENLDAHQKLIREEYAIRLAHKRLEDSVKAFQEASGIDMTMVLDGSYRARDLGQAVKLALEVSGHKGQTALAQDIAILISTAGRLFDAAGSAATNARALRALLEPGHEHTHNCRSRFRVERDQACDCGVVVSEVERKLGLDEPTRVDETEVPAAVVATRNDDPGRGVDRGGAGQDVQDAGTVVWNLSPEVPHG